MTARVRAARVPSMYCTAAFDLQLNRVHEIETGVLYIKGLYRIPY